jgi:antitoxin VapB
VSLNIKNERVHDLVREAARRTGKSQTSVVEEALRRYLDELSRAAGHDRTDEILAEIRKAWRDGAGADRMEIEDLYDPDTGLPA